MSERKEPGQLAYEAAFRADNLFDRGPWSMQDDEDREAWAAVEAACKDVAYDDAAKCAGDRGRAFFS